MKGIEEGGREQERERDGRKGGGGREKRWKKEGEGVS